MSLSKKHYLPIWIGIIVFLADALTKFLTQEYIPLMHHTHVYPFGGIGIFQNFLGVDFSIVHATNRGAAWGLFAEYQEYLLYLRVALIFGTLLYIIFYNKEKEYQIPLTLIVVGASGNVFDYFLYGHVIDMLHFVFGTYQYPVFNLADSAIFVGIFWLFVASWLAEKKLAKQKTTKPIKR